MSTTTTTTTSTSRYVEPGWFTTHVFNRLVRRATRMGIGVWGSRELHVRGRRSGELRSTVVNVLELEGQRYLVAPRGTTQWVRNLRAARGEGELRIGRRIELFTSSELVDPDDQVPVLRAYLRRWAFEVGMFFDGVSADSSAAELARIAGDHPVFRLDQAR